MELTIHVLSHGNADELARRLVADLRSMPQVREAALHTRNAAPGEKGIVEELGAVGVSLMNAGGAEALIFCLKALFPQINAPMPGSEKEIIVEIGGNRVELKGTMSDADFRDTADRVLTLLEKN